MRRNAEAVAEEIPADEITFEVMAKRLSKDVKLAGAKMNRSSARFMVDTYYQLQTFRQASDRMVKDGEKAGEESTALQWVAGVHGRMELAVRAMLGVWAEQSEVGRWSIAQYGIGPVIAAGMLAHIEIDKVQGVGQIWSFAGLNPTVTWEKGQKRPWNARLKTLCWKMANVFLKFKGREECAYGQALGAYWGHRKVRNERGDFRELAASTLAAKKFRESETKEHYEAGELPDGRVLLQAERWIAKMFLAHWFWVAWEAKHGTPAPLPYIFRDGGHRDLWAPPGYDMLKRNDPSGVKVHRTVGSFLQAQGFKIA